MINVALVHWYTQSHVQYLKKSILIVRQIFVLDKNLLKVILICIFRLV